MINNVLEYLATVTAGEIKVRVKEKSYLPKMWSDAPV